MSHYLQEPGSRVQPGKQRLYIGSEPAAVGCAAAVWVPIRVPHRCQPVAKGQGEGGCDEIVWHQEDQRSRPGNS